MRNEDFEKDLAAFLNKWNMERFSNTPDFVLASYLSSCLANFDNACNARATWYGRHDEPGSQARNVEHTIPHGEYGTCSACESTQDAHKRGDE